MNRSENKNIKLALIIILAVAALAAGEVRAQSNDTDQLSFSKNGIETLKTGINSDNLGLRRSSIYLVGKYRISETKETLINLISKEEDPNTRILIALVLFKIGDPDGLNLVREFGHKDSDTKVRKMCRAIYNEYLVGNLGEYASIIETD